MRSTVAAATATALLLSGCGALAEDDDPGSTAGGGQVVAAFYPLQYVADRVAGDGFDVQNLTSPGSEPHDLELGVRETALVTDADLLLYVGGFQPAVDDAAAENTAASVLDVADVVGLLPFEEGEEDAGEVDPHFWHDPMLMADLGDAVAERMAEIDPANADAYTGNAADLRDDLEALDQQFADGLAECRIDTVVTNHDAVGYLAKYGLELESIAGISPDAEPTPAELAALQDLIEQAGITTVFSETLVSRATAETLANDLGVDTAVLDTVEGLTDDTADEDYLSLMRSNLAALQEANGC
ncbi:MAG: metal ABC transporter substrate-binding protein [Nocardioides sp.]